MRARSGALSFVVAASILTMATTVAAAGPSNMARADRSLWPHPLDSPAAFDLASRAEILSFVAALGETQSQDAVALAQTLGIKQVAVESVAAWRTLTSERLAENFRHASAQCRQEDWLCDSKVTAAGLASKAGGLDASVPEALRAWRENARLFHRVYALEQLRLAALFPHPTSEIQTFSAHEKTGFELADRQFLLTFDDGPTATGGTSDSLLAVLRAAGHNGIFYMLGERLTARLTQEKAESLRADFQGMCVASHGFTHKSHQSLPEWQRSVTDTADLLRPTFGPLYKSLFRPPYGQRKTDSGAFFAQQGLEVALWNVDSQDWSAKLSADDVEGRVASLMLLWRRGVILFHDVHDKARVALPRLWTRIQSAGVVWLDCTKYPQ
jgi:peptidoglycan-N-acetylglucosamine deacetylase